MVAENTIVNQGIDLIKQAVEADHNEEHENALGLYQDGLTRVAHGIKYEKNESRRKLLMDRAGGWMKRAEELKEQVNKEKGGSDGKEGGSGGGEEKVRRR